MIDILLTIFWGLVLLTVIVFIHEAGHFAAARLFKLRVKEFMIGLPGPKVSVKRGDTSYGATAIPLGGYCLIAGMEKEAECPGLKEALAFIAYFGKATEEEASRAGTEFGFDLVEALDTLADWGTVYRSKSKEGYSYALAATKTHAQGQPREIANPTAFLEAERKLTYTALPWWKRIIILLAGSFSNLVVSLLILMTMLMVMGVQAPTTTIEAVAQDSPAAAAGMVAGDTLTTFAGTAYDDWDSFITALRSAQVGETVEIGYLHEGQEHTARVALADNAGVPLLGVTTHVEQRMMDPLTAFTTSVSLIGTVFQAIVQLINPSTFADTIGQTSSVVGISMEARNAADSGPLPFIVLIAALSISIGLMNLLPIPPLDGGKIIIETIERLTHRRLPVSVVNGISMAGLAAMILLFVVATNADIHRYFLGG